VTFGEIRLRLDEIRSVVDNRVLRGFRGFDGVKEYLGNNEAKEV
jgi:hypothetical protein